MQGLTPGRQVHYVDPDTGVHRAAVIVKSDFPQEDMAPPLVELYVYPLNEDYTITSINAVGSDSEGAPVEEETNMVVSLSGSLVGPLATPPSTGPNPLAVYSPNCEPGTWHWIEPA